MFVGRSVSNFIFVQSTMKTGKDGRIHCFRDV